MVRRNSPGKICLKFEHSVEAQFLHRVLLGESILPFRTFRTFEGVVPATQEGAILDADAAANRGYAGLLGWMTAAETIWNQNAASGAMKLIQRWNYHNELGSQFPTPPLRVVYAKAGSLPAACLVRDQSVIDHKLYWCSPVGDDEAYYLISIMNSETARERSAGLQSRGQWGARDFDKVIFTLPIPRFDEKSSLHMALASAGRDAERLAASVVLPEGIKFRQSKKRVRDALTEAGISPRIDDLVARLLDET